MKNLFHFKSSYKSSLIVSIIFVSFLIALITSAVVYGYNQRKLQEILMDKNRSMQEQLVNTVDALFAEIDRISIQYSLNRTVSEYAFREVEKSEDYKKVSDLLSEISALKTFNPLISSIDILYPHKKFIISNSTYRMNELKELNQIEAVFFESLIKSEKSYNIEKREKLIGTASVYKTIISVSRYFERGKYGGITVVVNIDRDSLLNTVKQVCLDLDAGFFITKDDNILLSNMDKPEDFLEKTGSSKSQSTLLNNVKVVSEDKTYYVMKSYMKFGGLEYGLIVPAEKIAAIGNFLNHKMAGLFFAILALCVTIGWIVSNFLYKPVRRLVREINQTPGNKDNEDPLDPKAMDDFGFIRNRFSTLVSKNDEVEAILSRSMPVIKRNFLANLVKGKVKAEEAYEKFDMYGLKLHDRYFDIVVMKIERDMGRSDLGVEEIASLAVHKLEEELEKLNGDVYKYALFELGNDKLCLILNYKDKEDANRNTLFQLCKHIQTAIQDFCGTETTVAAGETADGIENLERSYVTAKALVEQSFLFEKGQIILYEDNFQNKAASIFYPLEEGNALVRAVKNCDNTEVNETLHTLKEKIKSKLKQNELQFILPQLISGVIHAIIESEAMSRQVLDEAYRLIQLKKELLIPSSPIHIEKYFSELADLFTKFIEYKQNKIMEKNDKLVHKAIEYIDAKFTENLTVENIADYLCISAGHLSRIFKLIKGITVMDYMTGKKLQYAMELLRNTDDQILDISKKAGYNCSRTFIRAFKLKYEVTPGRVREGRM